MVYDNYLTDRVRSIFTDKHIAFIEKKMMGGLCFMVNNKMCVGVDQDKQGNDRLMVRLDPEFYQQALTFNGASPMDFTGRPMTGYVFVNAEGMNEGAALIKWIDHAIEFNPKAKSSKKRKP